MPKVTAPEPPIRRLAGPETYGASEHAPRGDYSRAGADFVVDQDWGRYSAAEHDRWRRLFARQMEKIPGRACDEFVAALADLDYDAGIPRFSVVNEQLSAATGWRLVGVPGLIPEQAFFEHLANRRFPVTTCLRRARSRTRCRRRRRNDSRSTCAGSCAVATGSTYSSRPTS